MSLFLEFITVVLTVVVLLWWTVYERVLLVEDCLVKKHKFKTERMPLVDISEIKFHYHAVVGFIAVWEFIDTKGDTLLINARAIGIKKLIVGLEEKLPGFSQAEFDRKFREGDVEDSIDVWKSP